MNSTSMLRRLLVLVALTATACTPESSPLPADILAPSGSTLTAKGGGGGGSGGGGGTGTIHLLSASPNAAPILHPSASFWAKKGEDRYGYMFYGKRRDGSGPDSSVFLRFRVPPKALQTRPDGSSIANGDSILITMTLVDTVHYEVRFEPSGLRFSNSNPARLRISFLEADGDLNGDGVVNASDDAIAPTLTIWRRESPTSPWLSQTSTVTLFTDDVESNVTGFTSYVVAW